MCEENISQEFRLKKIVEIRNHLLTKKRRKVCTTLN